MTTGSQRAGAGAASAISGAVTSVIIRYVRERRNKTGVYRLVAGAGERRSIHRLEDTAGHSSEAEVLALIGSAARVLGDPEVALRIGEEMIRQYDGTEIAQLFTSSGTVSSRLRSAVSTLGRLFATSDVVLVDDDDVSATVRATATRGRSRPLALCDFTKGYLSQLPALLAGSSIAGEASLVETECQARGGRSCVYEVTWSHHGGLPSEELRPIGLGESADAATDANRDELGIQVAVSAPVSPDAPQRGGHDREEETRHDSWATPVTGVPVTPTLEEVRVARLEEQIRDLTQRLEQAYSTAGDLVFTDNTEGVLGRIASRAADAVGASRHMLAVRAPDGVVIEVHSGGFTDDEITRFSAQLLGDEEGSFPSTALVVDVASSRSCFGRLVVFATSRGFARNDRQILDAYAAYAASALDVATALEQARLSHESANALLDFSRTLAGASTVDEVAERLAETVPVVTRCDRSTVMLWDPDEQAVTVRAATGPGAEAARRKPEERAGFKIHREQTALFERVVNSHELTVVDLDTDDELVRAVLEGTGTACAVIAPLSAADEFLGIVTANFDHPPARDPRVDFELQTRMTGLADHAVTAMQNTRLLEQVTHLAWHDALTGLPNRRLLEDRVNQELVRARRNGESTCMFFIDLDRLKHVNDNFGHASGDELIRHVAERLVDTVRRQDTVARLGGDEFAVLLPGLADLGDIDTLARRTLDALRRRYLLLGREVHVSGSIGVAVAPGHGETYDELLSNADAAMYRAKSLGRDTYQLYSVPDGDARPDVQLEVDLKHAVERAEIGLVYQPVIDMRTSEFVGVEALARWNHPVRGVLDPSAFLAIARDPEVIAGIDTWVVSDACRQTALWSQSGLKAVRVSVSVSGRSLAFDGFAESVQSAIRSWLVQPGTLELEVSEFAAIEAEGPARRAVDQLVSAGVSFAVEDVGAASAAPSRLGTIPVSTLKLDSSFVQQLGEDDETRTLVSAIVSITARHGITCVAEGVETEQQARALIAQGCWFGQGFLFSPPLLASDVEQMLVGNRKAPTREDTPGTRL